MFSKPSLAKPYTHVFSQDPAIDQDHEDFDHEQWVKTGDPKYHPMKNGVNAVEFKIRHLSEHERALVYDMQQSAHGGQLSGATMMVRMAITGWSNMRDTSTGDEIESGQVLEPSYGRPSLDDDSFKVIRRAPAELFGELVDRITQATFGDPTSLKG